MSKKVLSAAVLGLDCSVVEVEADTSPALPGIFIVGLPDKAVDESKERVRSAIKNSGLELPRGKITINLAPADLRKAGPSYDLPIAVSILLTTKQLVLGSKFNEQLFIGELALDGSLRGVQGTLLVCLMAKKQGITTVYLPKANAAEAALVKDLTIYPVENLQQLAAHLLKKKTIIAYQSDKNYFLPTASAYDMLHIKGQEHVKRALEIAVAGGHNILMSGSPGSGKTLLAKTLVSIMPKMTEAEALEVTRIYSVAGLLPINKPLITTRPFRSPHHTASRIACTILR